MGAALRGAAPFVVVLTLAHRQKKGAKMAYSKSIAEKVNGAGKIGNREQRRRFMKQFGLLKGATRKRTASLKVVR